MLLRYLTLLISPLALAACAATSASPAPIRAAPALPEIGHVSSADPRASAAGMAMLEQGGSATDAAIAVMLALTVVEPQSSGIGGGGFYMHADANGEVVSLDGRETAPQAADGTWFLDDEGAPLGFFEAVLGGRSVGVPGNIALAAQAHRRYGKLEWRTLFQPAIALAGDGFVITERFRNFLSFGKQRAAFSNAGKALFYDAQGEPLPAGTLVRNPQLAQSLTELAQQGPEWFYQGEAAEQLAQLVSTNTPGDEGMNAQDLASYQAIWRDPVCGTYRQYRICGMGPPSSGATTVFAILKQLEGFDISALGPDSPSFWHLFAESQRLVYADRELYLGDSDFVSVPVTGLMDAEYLRQRGALISANARMASVEAGTPPGANIARADGDEPAENGTSHFVALDAQGNVVTYTSTIEGSFGSGLMFGGFYLNNELTDFSFVPERNGVPVANAVQSGKRPRSSMSPTLVFGPEGELRIAIGAAGGGTIPVQVAKALIGVLDWNLTAEEAIGLPGLYSPGDTITVESDSPLLAMQNALEALGHSVASRNLPFKANAVEYREGAWLGAADPRSEGVALGR